MKFLFAVLEYHSHWESQCELLELASELHKRGHEVYLFCNKVVGDKPGWLQVHTTTIKSIKRYKKLFEFNLAFLDFKRNHTFDCIVGFEKLAQLDFYFAMDDCFIAEKKNRKWWRRLFLKTRLMKELEHFVFAKSSKTHIFYISQRQKEYYQQHYPLYKDRFTILAPALPDHSYKKIDNQYLPEKVRQRLHIADDEFMLITIANNYLEQGIDRTLNALAQLAPQLKERCHFVVLGEIQNKKFKRKIKKAKLEERVHHITEYHCILPYLHAADLLLYPARPGTMGLELLQAMASGLPSISTSACHYAYVVTRAQAGKIIPEPFSQARYNQSLLKFLHPSVLNDYKKNAAAYASHLKPGASARHAAEIIINKAC